MKKLVQKQYPFGLLTVIILLAIALLRIILAGGVSAGPTGGDSEPVARYFRSVASAVDCAGVSASSDAISQLDVYTLRHQPNLSRQLPPRQLTLINSTAIAYVTPTQSGKVP